jgi:nitrite reductase (NADH) large subunit
MIVCHCKNVSDRRIRLAVRNGARSVEEVRAACGAGTCCGGCLPLVSDLIADEQVECEGQDAPREAPVPRQPATTTA